MGSFEGLTKPTEIKFQRAVLFVCLHATRVRWFWVSLAGQRALPRSLGCVAGCLHFGTFYRFHVHSCLAYISETYDCPKGHSVGTASGVVYLIFLGFSVVVIDMFKSIIVLSKCFLWYWRRQHVLSAQKVHGVVFMATLTNANGLLHWTKWLRFGFPLMTLLMTDQWQRKIRFLPNRQCNGSG